MGFSPASTFALTFVATILAQTVLGDYISLFGKISALNSAPISTTIETK